MNVSAARRIVAASLALLLARVSCLATPVQRVALVTGASRGIGKGIAVELGRSGFAVYAVGRSSRSGRKNSQSKERILPPGSDLTVEATAEEITVAGGRGLALQCDVGDEADLERVLARVREAEGRLDVLVCSAYSTPPGALRDEFWKQGLDMWDAVNNIGLRSVYATCCAATPLMIETAARGDSTDPSVPPPLICLVSSFGGKSYTFNVAYGVGKAAVDRLAQDMSVQVRSAVTTPRARWLSAHVRSVRPPLCPEALRTPGIRMTPRQLTTKPWVLWWGVQLHGSFIVTLGFLLSPFPGVHWGLYTWGVAGGRVPLPPSPRFLPFRVTNLYGPSPTPPPRQLRTPGI